jgi:N-methylhydantoinase B
MISPLFIEDELEGFVVNRAHHADIGADTPGSMPVSSTLQEEGIIISPSHLYREGVLQKPLYQKILSGLRNPELSKGDFEAQVSANRAGLKRLQQWIGDLGVDVYREGLQSLNRYAEQLAAETLNQIPQGCYTYEDVMDDDGQGNHALPIRVSVEVNKGKVRVDFSGTAKQTAGNINAPLSVAAAAVYYLFRTLMPPQTPAAAGSFRAISIAAPKGSLLNALFPAAVAAGNVETSSRVVDVVMGALSQAIPQQMAAASQGTMNNLAMGGRLNGRYWDYYETIGGGMGAGPCCHGLSARQTHMTNTLNTPVEVLEMTVPVRVQHYGIRLASGGSGCQQGGDGIVRSFQFLHESRVTLLTERRESAPWGLQQGECGAVGENELDGAVLPAKCSLKVKAGQVLTIRTPGGGGYGSPQ